MKIILMYLDEDYDEVPVVIVDPPANFGTLATEWKRLDDELCETGEEPEGWKGFSEWMAEHGVTIIDADMDNIKNY